MMKKNKFRKTKIALFFLLLIGTPLLLSGQITEEFDWGLSFKYQIQSRSVNGFVYDNFVFDNYWAVNTVYTTNRVPELNAVSPATITLENPIRNFDLESINLATFRPSKDPETIQISGLRDGVVVACYQVTIPYSNTSTFLFSSADIESGVAIVSGAFKNIDQLVFEHVEEKFEFVYDDFTYTWTGISTEEINFIYPSNGSPLGNTPVIVYGSNFTNATQVYFGNTPASSFSVVSNSEIIATSPPGIGMVDLMVAVSGESYNYGATFYYNPPVIDSLSQYYSCPEGGTEICISGMNFTGATSVNFGSNLVTNFTVVSDSAIRVMTPADTGKVRVSVASKSIASNAIELEYREPFIGFTAQSSRGAESVTSVEIPIRLSFETSQVVTVGYEVVGTASGDGIDYTLASGTLTLDQGETTDTLHIVDIVDDVLQEEDESVIIVLSIPTHAILDSNFLYLYVIEDNDTPTNLVELPQNELTVYPNPFTDRIYLDGIKMNISKISIVNSCGTIVLSQSICGEKELNLEHLSSGIYILMLESESGETQKIKIVKKLGWW